PLHVTQQVNDSPRGGGHFDFYPANDLTPDPEIALRLLQSAKINISLAVQRDIHRCGGRLHPTPMNGYRPVVAAIPQYSTPDRRRDPQVAVNIAYQPVILGSTLQAQNVVSAMHPQACKCMQKRVVVAQVAVDALNGIEDPSLLNHGPNDPDVDPGV